MKTTITLVLVVIIGMMVNGQTTFNQKYSDQFMIGGTNQKLDQGDLNKLNDLLDQASTLKTEYTNLRSAASGSQGKEKNKMNSDASRVYKKYEEVQIEISELTAKITYQKYDLNKISIKTLMSINTKNEGCIDKIDHALTLLADAEKARVSAIDMREEAYAQTNNSAKLGSMGNAEEKELIAITKQNEAIVLLEKANLDAINAFASVK